MASPSVARVCVVARQDAQVLAEVAVRIGEFGFNIVGTMTRSRGNLSFQVVDVEMEPEQTSQVVEALEKLPDVKKVTTGTFGSASDEAFRDVAPQRLCVVTDNVPGALGRVAGLLSGTPGVAMLAQVNRSRGKMAFNVFDMDSAQVDWEKICRKVEELDVVYSCTLGSFKAGGLSGPELGENASSLDHAASALHAYTGQLHTPHPSGDWDSALSKVVTIDTKATLMEEGAPVDEISENSASDLSSYPDTQPSPTPSAPDPVTRPSLLWAGDTIERPSSATGTDYYEEGYRGRTRSRKLTLVNERCSMTMDKNKLVIAMVGLPARGKSFTARKLQRFLCWRNRAVRIFNAGRYRRERGGSADGEEEEEGGGQLEDRASFFGRENEKGRRIRAEAAQAALQDLLDFLEKQERNAVGIFDATNSTQSRREWLTRECQGKASVVFLEVICDDEEVLHENLMAKIRSSPDFAGMDEDAALEDLKIRIANYTEAYEPVEDNNLSYIKIYNMSTRILANKIYGRLARSILPYMLSLHIGLRPIWFVRAGLSEASRISLNPERDFLSPSTEKKGAKLNVQGRAFAAKLAEWIKTAVWLRDDDDDDLQTEVNSTVGRLEQLNSIDSNMEAEVPRMSPEDVFEQTKGRSIVRKSDGTRQKGAKLKVLSSTLPRAEETAKIALSCLGEGNVVEPCSMLNPLDKGELAGLSMKEIKAHHEEFYEKWIQDRFAHRFPGGESYEDLVTRLEPILIEIEQQTAPVLIVSHVSCIQGLLAYYMGCSVHEAMRIDVPMHKLIEITPTIGGSWDMNVYSI